MQESHNNGDAQYPTTMCNFRLQYPTDAIIPRAYMNLWIECKLLLCKKKIYIRNWRVKGQKSSLGNAPSMKMGPPSDCCHGDSHNNVGSTEERRAAAMTEEACDMWKIACKERLGEGQSSYVSVIIHLGRLRIEVWKCNIAVSVANMTSPNWLFCGLID